MVERVDVNAFLKNITEYLDRATLESIVVTVDGEKRWALIPYSVFEQLSRSNRRDEPEDDFRPDLSDPHTREHRTSKPYRDEPERPGGKPSRRPPDRDYTDEETIAILEGRMRNPEAPDEPDEPDEPQR